MKRLGVALLILAPLMALTGLWAWALGIGWGEPVWTAYSYTVVAVGAGGLAALIASAPWGAP